MRIAVISMHTSPTAPLGQQAAGGMNVYVREVCTAFSDRGIATDVFTRVQSDDDPRIEQLAPLSRVIYLDAGSDLDKYSLYREVPQFASRIFNHVLAEDPHYDLHALIELVERGCQPDLAVRILAPVEQESAA